MKNITYRLVQWHTDTISKPDNSEISKYYENIWKQEHYYKPEAFWELPKWAGELSYCLNKAHKEYEFTVLTSPNDELAADYVFGSVLDCNKHLYTELINNNPNTLFLLGGYVKEFLDERENVVWMDSIRECMNMLDIPYSYGADWSLFNNMPCIPRLTMSTGCLHKCKFCTIPNNVVPLTGNEIFRQVMALKPLRFDLVYIDDKTFGQCFNYTKLKSIAKTIKRFNPNFIGFIVQTTASIVKKVKWEDLCVYAAEIGVESYNNEILKELHKPANIKTIEQAERTLENNNIKYIPNIIVGFTQETKETYNNTIQYLKRSNSLHANIYNLAIYEEAELSSEVEANGDDLNELISEKSFNSKEKNELNLKTLERMAEIMNTKLNLNRL